MAPVMRQTAAPIKVINKNASNIEISSNAHTPRFACAAEIEVMPVVVSRQQTRKPEKSAPSSFLCGNGEAAGFVVVTS
jgi:hypothetical protein